MPGSPAAAPAGGAALRVIFLHHHQTWATLISMKRKRLLRRATLRWVLLIVTTAFTVPGMASTPVEEEDLPGFNDDLQLVDNALKTNSTGALPQSRRSCLKQRNFAVELNRMGMEERARRTLQYCFDSLNISRETVARVTGPSQEELQARANREFEKALSLTPDVDNGRAVYSECAACHEPEGWGLTTGSVPQIAGQHRKVLIKQLADFRAGNRDSVLMVPYATVEAIGGAQAVADVAEYISTLEISVDNGKGPGTDLKLGERLYAEHCAGCHGGNGEGSNDGLVPRIQAQHYNYLERQFTWIRDGKRRNAGEKMAIAERLSERQIQAVLDYVSWLMPPEELRAPPGWKNPDFASRPAE
jgi:cytochrome c553